MRFRRVKENKRAILLVSMEKRIKPTGLRRRAIKNRTSTMIKTVTTTAIAMTAGRPSPEAVWKGRKGTV